jgi:hypothetical protein
MKYIKTYESIFNNEIDFSSEQEKELYDLGFVKDDYYDVLAFYYTPTIQDKIKNIRISKIQLENAIDPMFEPVSSFRVDIFQANNKRITKEFPKISMASKVMNKMGMIKFNMHNLEYFDQAIEYIKQYIPEIDNDIKKYNL